METIKTWQERAEIPGDTQAVKWTGNEEYMAAEITDLRAALNTPDGESWQQRCEDLTTAVRYWKAKASQAEAAPVGALTTAASDVIAERRRQIERENFSHRRDDNYLKKDLACAAASYALYDKKQEVPWCWPWDERWWNPTDYRQNLIKSGALLLAEIERIDRANNRGEKK